MEKQLSLKERIALLNAKAKAPLAPPRSGAGAAVPLRKSSFTATSSLPLPGAGVAIVGAAAEPAAPVASPDASMLASVDGALEVPAPAVDGSVAAEPPADADHDVDAVMDDAADPLPTAMVPVIAPGEPAVLTLMLAVGSAVPLGLRLGKPDADAPAAVLDVDADGQAGRAGVARGAELLMIDGRDVARGWTEAALEGDIAAMQARGDGSAAAVAREAEFVFRMPPA